MNIKEKHLLLNKRLQMVLLDHLIFRILPQSTFRVDPISLFGFIHPKHMYIYQFHPNIMIFRSLQAFAISIFNGSLEQ